MNRKLGFGLLAAVLLMACQIPGRIETATTGYRVYYSPGNAETGAPPEDPSVYKADATVVILENRGGLARPGFGFARWNTRNDGAGDAYLPGETLVMPAADLVLYPTWE